MQAATAYASLINGGRLISPTLKKNENFNKKWPQIVSEETSNELRGVLRKVVTEEKGTASLANVLVMMFPEKQEQLSIIEIKTKY